MANIFDDPDSLTHRIIRGLNVGADVESLHDQIVTLEGKTSEEDFHLAFVAAQLMYSFREAQPPTGR